MAQPLLQNKFDTTEEELKKQGKIFIAHDVQASRQYKKWMTKDEVWNKYQNQKNRRIENG